MKKIRQDLYKIIKKAAARGRIRTVLVLITVFCVTHSLIIPALTLDQQEALEQGGIDVPMGASAESADDAFGNDDVTAEEDQEEVVSESDSESSEGAFSDGADIEEIDTDADEVKDNTKNKDAGSDDQDSSINIDGSDADAEITGSEEIITEAQNQLVCEGDGFIISVEDLTMALPEGSELTASEILPDDKDFDKYLEEAEGTLGLDKGQSSYARLFDISIIKDGEEMQPEGTVGVTIEL